MACKSCGASKVVGRFCAYCRNPSTEQPNRNIYYVDVGEMSIEELSALGKMYQQHLDRKLDFNPATILQDIVWPLCQTPTHGRMMSV